MPILPPIRDSRVNSRAIITYAQNKVVSISEFHFQAACPGMRTGIVYCFVTDAIDFIADKGMHLSGIAKYRESHRGGARNGAIFDHAPESFTEVVLLRRRGAQRVQGCPSFLRGS